MYRGQGQCRGDEFIWKNQHSFCSHSDLWSAVPLGGSCCEVHDRGGPPWCPHVVLNAGSKGTCQHAAAENMESGAQIENKIVFATKKNCVCVSVSCVRAWDVTEQAGVPRTTLPQCRTLAPCARTLSPVSLSYQVALQLLACALDLMSQVHPVVTGATRKCRWEAEGNTENKVFVRQTYISYSLIFFHKTINGTT